MAEPKFKIQFQHMMDTNKELFKKYEELKRTNRKKSPELEEEYQDIKFKILRVIRKNEDMLCSKSENTKKFSAYSQNLADKFQEEIRQNLPDIYE